MKVVLKKGEPSERLRVVIEAETDADRVALGVLHAEILSGSVSTYACSQGDRSDWEKDGLGPVSITFGTMNKGPSAVYGSFTPDQKQEIERLLSEAKSAGLTTVRSN